MKPSPLDLPKLYPVTDARLAGLTHAEQVVRLSEGGATFIQLREKHLTPREFYREAREALRAARARGVRLIINDRVDLALALGADGVHLGQDDLPPERARLLLGPRAIIGFSTHGLEQAVRAALLPVDYIALGPVFATSSKEKPDPVIGLDGLRQVSIALRQVSAALRGGLPPVPLVAIGGISHANGRETLAGGADSLAVIGALLAGGPDEITPRTRALFAHLTAPAPPARP